MFITHTLWRNDLLRACEIAAIDQRFICGDAAVIVSCPFQAVVYNYIRLVGAHHFNQLSCLPFFPSHIIIRKVKPQKIQLAVIGHKLFYLSMHVFQIPVKINFFILVCQIVPHWMLPVPIFGKVRMMPVNNGKIKSYL